MYSGFSCFLESYGMGAQRCPVSRQEKGVPYGGIGRSHEQVSEKTVTSYSLNGVISKVKLHSELSSQA